MSELDSLVDLGRYAFRGQEAADVPDLTALTADSKRELRMVGVDVDAEAERAGTFLQFDHSTVHCRSTRSGVEVLGIRQALKKYNGLPEYFWKAIDPDTNALSQAAARKTCMADILSARKEGPK